MAESDPDPLEAHGHVPLPGAPTVADFLIWARIHALEALPTLHRRPEAIQTELDIQWMSVPITPGTRKDTGTFAGPIVLYRLIDHFELQKLAWSHGYQGNAAVITGGRWSVAAEQAGGASYGTNPEQIIRWGIAWRDRLRPPLYLIAIQGDGRSFVRLDLKKGLETPQRLRRGACSTALGCSVHATLADVIVAWRVDLDGSRHPVDWLALLQNTDASDVPRRSIALDELDRAYRVLYQLVFPREESRLYGPALRRWEQNRDAQIERILVQAAPHYVLARDTLPGESTIRAWSFNIVDRQPKKIQNAWNRARKAAEKELGIKAPKSVV